MTWMSDMEQRVLNVEKALQHLGDLYEGMKAELVEIDPPVTFELEDPPGTKRCGSISPEGFQCIRYEHNASTPHYSDQCGNWETPAEFPMQCSNGTCKENAETLRKARLAIVPTREDNDGEDVLDRVRAVLGVTP